MADYANSVSPRKVMQAAQRGFQRLHNFRAARLMFLRNYTGQYYDRSKGDVGSEPLNMIFNAIRVLVPNIVLNFPKHSVVTPYLASKRYADLLGLALSQHDKQIDITNIYRTVIVDALFTLGIMKTGLAQSDDIYSFDENDRIDAGTIYTERVDFDNFVVDPSSKEHLFADAKFMGDKMCIPRETLLSSGLYKNDLIERLPRAGGAAERKVSSLSMNSIDGDDNYDLEDMVEVVELWVPSANALLTIPGDEDISFDDYLRVDDYYGVKEGAYTFLALTPPVPGNPLPVPNVSVWNDLHIRINRMGVKVMDQAERQKDIIGYKRSAADDVEEMRNAMDGDSVAMDDPDAVRVHSFGGQKNSNEAHLGNLSNWFNLMAANPNQMGGMQQGASSATGTMILQQNAGVGLEDMKDLVYQAAAGEARKRAWYFHTDPLMNIPLTKREQQPAEFFPGPLGPIMLSPPMQQEVQVILTPEARSGDFIDFQFNIEPESMGRKDSRTRLAVAMDFCVKVMPAVVSTAQAFMMLGLPFSAKAMILRMAKEAGIDWMEEVFYDPEFQMMMMQQMAMGPQMDQSRGQAQPSGGGMGAIQQNGQPGNVMGGMPSQQEETNSFQQQGGVPGQQMTKQGY